MKKRLLSIFAVLIMALTLAMAMSVTAWAGETEETTETVGSYTVLLPEGVTLPPGAGSDTTVTTVTKDDTEWGEVDKTTWYVVTGTVTIDHTVTVLGDVHLILADGCKLTVNVTSGNGITVGTDCSLTIYAQSEGNGMGSLTVTCAEDSVGIGLYSDDGETEIGNLTVNGGKISVSNCARGLCGKSITVSGGDISINCSLYGIMANSVNIAGGDVDVFGSDNGIFAFSFNMTDGDVTAKNSVGTSDYQLHSAICCYTGNVMISGGSLNAIGTNFGIGVYSGGITISGDDTVVNASGRISGIYSDFSLPYTISISGASVTACSDYFAILAKTINVSEMNFANEDVFISAGENAVSVNTVFADRENTTNLAPSNTEEMEASLSGNKYVRIGTAVCYVDADSSGTLNDGDTEYGSVQAAVNAAGETATTVRLIADDTENVTIPAGRNITLDLNGKVLKGDGTTSVIINNGTLTIKDSTTEGDTPTATTRYFTDAKCEHGETIGETCTRSNSNCKGNNNTALADDCYETYTTIMPANMTGVLTVVGGCITGGTAEKGGGINNSGTLYLKGGNIVGNLVSKGNEYDGGGVYNSGTFEMSSGVILGNASFYCGGGVYNGGTFKMTGGSITGNTATTGGGGVGTHSTFTMSAGTISGNTTKNGMGAGVGVSYGSFTMEGGEISGNSALGEEGYGGGVCVQGATFTMKDGEISGNTANYGGGVDNQGTVNLTGGSVTGNTATTVGGGVLHWGADSCTLGGTVQITGNTASGTADNMTLFMTSVAIGTKTGVSEGNGVAVPVAKDPQDASKAYMNVGITMLDEDFKLTSGAFTTNGASTDTQYFFSDVPAYSVKFKTDHLELAEKTVCKIGDTEYASIDAALDAAHGSEDATHPTTITLIDNDTENVTIPAGRNITLDLNGFVLKADLSDGNKHSVITNKGTLSIKDTATTNNTHYFKVAASGLWKIQTDEPESSSIDYDFSNGVLKKHGEETATTDIPAKDKIIRVTGGCISGGEEAMLNGAIENSGNLTLESGNLIGNVGENAAGVSNENTGKVSITGGNIIGNISDDGTCGVRNNGELNISNGTVAYNTVTKNGGAAGINNDEQGKLIMTGGNIKYNQAMEDVFCIAGVLNSGSMVMTGGKISNNKAGTYNFGGVCNGGAMTVGGTASITGNVLTDDIASNCCTVKNNPIAIGTDDNAPEAEMKIGVSVLDMNEFSYVSGQFTTNGTEDHVKYFTSDNQAYKVKFVPATTGESAVAAHLELVNYDLNKIASNTTSITLEKDAMTKEQAIAIAKAQKASLSKSTVIAYAILPQSKYSVITSSNGTDWTEGTDITLAQMKDDIANKDYFVIGTVTNHTHSWTYALSTTTKNNDTITATCGNAGCPATDTKLIITASDVTYDGNEHGAVLKASEDASSAATSFCGGNLPTITYEKKNDSKRDAVTGKPTDAGEYKASFSAGTGTGEKTASVEYKIDKAQSSATPPTAAPGLTYNGQGQELVSGGSATHGTLKYALGENATTAPADNWGEAVPKGTDAKKYNVWYKSVGDTNYKDSEPGCVEVSIGEKEVTVSGITAENKTYDGDTSATLKYDGLSISGTVDSETITATATGKFDNRNVGTGKTVNITNITLADKPGQGYVKNYKLNNSGTQTTATADITKKDIFVTADDKTSVAGEDLVELTYTSYDLCEGDSFTGSLATGADNDKAGSYDITQGTLAINDGNSGNNYDMTFTGGTYTVTAKPTPTPVVTKYTVTFDVQGHGTAPKAQTITAGGKVTKPDDPTETGYVFEGWFKEAACTNAWDFDKDTVSANTKIYAKWSEEEPTPVIIKDGFMATGTAKKATNTIKWNAVEDADGYDVYYAKCGKTLKKIKSTTALKYTKKGLKTKNIYKYQIKAYEKVAGEKEYIATTPVIHIAGSKASRSNATKVTANPEGVHMEAGDTQTIKTKIAKKSSKKTVLWKGHVSAKIRYMSTDKSIVTVDSKGKVKAIGEGEAYVYAYAASGAFAKVTVIVE